MDADETTQGAGGRRNLGVAPAILRQAVNKMKNCRRRFGTSFADKIKRPLPMKDMTMKEHDPVLH